MKLKPSQNLKNPIFWNFRSLEHDLGWSDRSQILAESFLAHTKTYKSAKLPLLKLLYFWSTPLPIPTYVQTEPRSHAFGAAWPLELIGVQPLNTKNIRKTYSSGIFTVHCMI
jgi:hypothetical protein